MTAVGTTKTWDPGVVQEAHVCYCLVAIEGTVTLSEAVQRANVHHADRCGALGDLHSREGNCQPLQTPAESLHCRMG